MRGAKVLVEMTVNDEPIELVAVVESYEPGGEFKASFFDPETNAEVQVDEGHPAWQYAKDACDDVLGGKN